MSDDGNDEIYKEIQTSLMETDGYLNRQFEDSNEGAQAIRMVLRNQRLTLAYFTNIMQDDHKKITEIYPWYKFSSWAAVTIGVLIISLLFMLATGQWRIVASIP